MAKKPHPGRLRRATLAVTALLSVLTAPAWAHLRISQTAGFSGPVAAGVKETTDGAKLCFDAINAKGGIKGQKMELESLDDKFDPKLAADNARSLITQKQVLSLFLTCGTPHTLTIVPLLDEFKVPLVAPSTGAMALHKPVNLWLFNVRAPCQRESERAVQHPSLMGIHRIGVVHVDDSSGADLLEGAQKGFATVSKTALFIE